MVAISRLIRISYRETKIVKAQQNNSMHYVYYKHIYRNDRQQRRNKANNNRPAQHHVIIQVPYNSIIYYNTMREREREA
jgi:hypothetical protein